MFIPRQSSVYGYSKVLGAFTLDIPLRRCNFCEFVFKTLPVRSKYRAETTNFYRPNFCHLKWQCDRSILNAKTKNEFVFLTSLLKTKNEFVLCFSYFTSENEKRKRNSFFVRKFENEKRKNGIYTDHLAHDMAFRCCSPTVPTVEQLPHTHTYTHFPIMKGNCWWISLAIDK